MCNKTDAQIGKIVRGVLGEIVDLMAEETRDKLLGCPRYEKVELGPRDIFEMRGLVYRYAMIEHASIIVAVFADEEVCNTVVKEFNHRFTVR